MKANIKAFIKAVQEFYFYMNHPNSTQMFFQSINPNGGFLQIFTDPIKFYSDQPESTYGLPYMNILLQRNTISKVKLFTLDINIDAASIEDGLLLQILLYHLFDQSYPESRKQEFKVLEAFIFGKKPTDLSDNIKSYVENVSAMLSETPTIDSIKHSD
ncbi:unnamed protein product [Allacma fusca]|uniref:Uncharacterized protein n=1 Tax=Allacma fusca TaxID=39272 RepID=A0A8J2PRV9_9HEXA|nr:unnamed protein product [Allacma fusca]